MIKAITSKHKKTDADYEEIAHLEFLGGLYMGEGGPVIPNYVLLGCIVNSAKKERKGPAAKAGIFIDEHSSLEYEGPRDAEGLWDDGLLIKDGGFVRQEVMPLRGSRILRTRPHFEVWSITTTIGYEDTELSGETLDGIMTRAGKRIGLCEWRPRYGRFSVEIVEEVDYAPSKDGKVAIPA